MTELLYEVSKNLDPLPCLRGLWDKDKYFGQKYESPLPTTKISNFFPVLRIVKLEKLGKLVTVARSADIFGIFVLKYG